MNKYKRRVPSGKTHIDVYDVIKMFGVTCPARQHAIKKLLCAGQRGVKDEVQDLAETATAIQRSLELIKEYEDEPFMVGRTPTQETI